MESLQCLEDLPPEKTLTPEMCFPSTAQMVAEAKKLMVDNKLSVLFIAADKQPNLQEFKKGLGSNVSTNCVVNTTLISVFVGLYFCVFIRQKGIYKNIDANIKISLVSAWDVIIYNM